MYVFPCYTGIHFRSNDPIMLIAIEITPDLALEYKTALAAAFVAATATLNPDISA